MERSFEINDSYLSAKLSSVNNSSAIFTTPSSGLKKRIIYFIPFLTFLLFFMPYPVGGIVFYKRFFLTLKFLMCFSEVIVTQALSLSVKLSAEWCQSDPKINNLKPWKVFLRQYFYASTATLMDYQLYRKLMFYAFLNFLLDIKT